MKRNRNLMTVAALGLLVIGLFVFVIVYANQPRTGVGPLTSAERAQELALQGKREQILTFGSGMIPLHEPSTQGRTPPAPRLFAIPVGQITLAEPQNVSSRASRASRGYQIYGAGGNFGLRVVHDGDDPSPVFGAFNNIIIYDKTDGSQKRVFDRRIAISAFKLVNRASRRVIVIDATSDDSDRDGNVDGDDIQQLYVYTLDDGQLHQVTGLQGSAGMVVTVQDVDYLVVEVTLDSDRDGRTSERAYSGGAGPEPQMLYRVDLRTFVATPLVEPKLADDLQTTLDGLPRAAAK